MKLKVFTLLALLAVLLGLTACCWFTPRAAKGFLNWISFEIVWRVVNAQHFDPTFGGLDWNEVHDRYQPLVLATVFAADSDSDFYVLINEMLRELNESHLGVVPPGYWPFVEPTAFGQGSIGIDVRLLDETAVITSVEPGSAGAQAGLRPSFVIQSIDGVSVEEIAEERLTRLEPPYNERNSITSELLSRIYGPPETYVSIAYLDEQGETCEKSIERTSRRGKSVTAGLPPTFVEFESKRLDSGIGYIRFNCFHPSLAQEFPSAIESMRDAPGLIIDLRGNSGGWRDVAVAGAEQLVGERTLCSTRRRRDGTSDLVLDPPDDSYEGPVVLLVDVMSKSSSEFFAACTQAIGRAVIIGERTPGSVGPAELMSLPNGATLIYPVAQEITLDGTVLEGRGVIPDIEVALDRSLLLQGIDSQLEAAISYIKNEVQK